ncbi:DNA-binding protein, partial [Pseudobacillus badius]
WSIELEKAGYLFERNDKGQRIYFERDFQSLKKLKELLAHSFTLKNAINAVTSMDLEEKNTLQTPSVHEEEIRLSKHELQALIQEEVKKAVEQERATLIEVFEHKLNNAIEARDQMFMQQLKISQEEKQKERTKGKEKVSWWRNIFSK